jgi:EAL domain-containing protein (putative c-di-GMP-specific phosphodiesterase class I)
MAAAESLLPASGITAAPLSEELLHDSIIEQALAGLRTHLGVEIAYVCRFAGEEMVEVTHLCSDLEIAFQPGFREPVEQSYSWHVLEGHMPEVLPDAAADDIAGSLGITAGLPVGCHLAQPLYLSNGSAWGCVCAVGLVPDPTLNQRDHAVLRAFASQVLERIERILEEDEERAATEARVEEMLDGSAITIFHQPIYALDGNEPVGVECLARFPNTNKRGPADWFDDAEKIGKGVELELAAVRSALETLDHVPDGKFATINVSPQTIVSGELEALLEGMNRDKLVIEVTDCQQVHIYAAMIEKMPQLKQLARIAMDHVGTGYSSLRHVAEFQPDFLKMDMTLTCDVDSDPARRALIGAMVELAREIGCEVVAEGVESAEERDAMAALGVSFGQGYFFARPLPVVAAQQHLLGQVDMDEEPDIAPEETRGTPEDDDQPVLKHG